MKLAKYLLTASLLLPSCASTSEENRGLVTSPQNPSRSAKNLDFNVYKQNEPMSEESSEYNFSLERIVLHGDQYFVQENTFQRPNEASFYLIKNEDALISLEGKISADNLYIPTRQTKKETRGSLTVEVPFTTARLESSGKHGIKAKMRSYDTSDVQTGIIESGSEDIEFQIKTLSVGYNDINGKRKSEEFYVPIVLDNNGIKDLNPDFLPTYLLSADNTTINLKTDGEIILKNTDSGILRPKRISFEDWEKRKYAVPRTLTVTATPATPITATTTTTTLRTGAASPSKID
jgi:hypothetical protein